jgi:hypothetical protein
MRAVILNDKQTAMLERLKAATSRFDDHPHLRGSPEAIDAAKELIGEAAGMDMPQISYAGLQLYVSMYENEMRLPEHLRDLSRLTGSKS